MVIRYLVTLIILSFYSLSALADDQNCPALLVKIGFDGQILQGSKQSVIRAVNRGETIRVRWDLDFDDDKKSDLTHWSDARFLSVWQGEVFTQVHAIHRQSPVRDKADIRLPDETNIWHGLIGTTGLMRGKMEKSDKSGERRVSSSWCSNRALPPQWTKIFKNDLSGKTMEGSKIKLFEAIRAGEPVRVGWGLKRNINGQEKSVEHIAEPVFITITDNNEISAQLPEHLAQESYWNSNKARFDNGSVMWRGILSSTGTFDAIWADRATGEIVRRSPQRAILSWYVLGKPAKANTLAVSRGIISDTPIKVREK